MSELGGGDFDQLPEAWRERLLRAGGAETKGDKGAGKGAEAGKVEGKGARNAGEAQAGL